MMDGVVALFGTPALARLADLVAMTRGLAPRRHRPRGVGWRGSLLARRLEVPGDRARHRTDVPVYARSSALRAPRSASPSCGRRPRPSKLWTSARPRCSPTSVLRRGRTRGLYGRVPASRVRSARLVTDASGRPPHGLLHPRHCQEHRRGRLRIGLAALERSSRRRGRDDGTTIDPQDEIGRSRANVVVAEFVPRRRARAGRLPGLPPRVGNAMWAAWCMAFRKWRCRGDRPSPRTPRCSNAPAPGWSSRRRTTPSTRSGPLSEVTGDPAFRSAAERFATTSPPCPTRTPCGPVSPSDPVKSRRARRRAARAPAARPGCRRAGWTPSAGRGAARRRRT